MAPFSPKGATSDSATERLAAAMMSDPCTMLVDAQPCSGAVAMVDIGHDGAVLGGDDNPVLGRIGDLEVRLAISSRDVRRAQRLRYQVFYEEMAAVPDAAAMSRRRDIDPFDDYCDHLLVLDHSAPKSRSGEARPAVVGTYRLLRQEVAGEHVGFYSASAFALGPILSANPGMRVLELGRSCVLKPNRNKRTVELLWHGIWTYVLRHRIDVLLGCASFTGTDPDELALPLSFLHHFAPSPAAWRVRAHDHVRVPMDRIAKNEIDPKLALRALPPLIKGYLRLGATFGDGAVVDRQFGTTDVLVMLPVAAINPRYIGHFGESATRHAA